MNAAAQIFALIAGLLHFVIFCMESLLFSRPQVHRRFLTANQDVGAVRPWAFNQGFYNLFLGLGAVGGVFLARAGSTTVGTSISLFACGCMLGAGLVLLLSDRRMGRAALMQGIPPLLALLFQLGAKG
jgi:putative membrane protein